MNKNYENKIVAFIDILGFKSLISNAEKNNTIITSLHQVLDYLKTWKKPSEWNLDLIEIEEDAQHKGVQSFSISNNTNCTCFSDSIVVSILVDDNNINEKVSTLITHLSYIGSY